MCSPNPKDPTIPSTPIPSPPPTLEMRPRLQGAGRTRIKGVPEVISEKVVSKEIYTTSNNNETTTSWRHSRPGPTVLPVHLS